MNQEIWESICDCFVKLKQPDSKQDEKIERVFHFIKTTNTFFILILVIIQNI